MTGERARVSVNPGEQGRARVHETPCLRKRQTRIISIEESSEDQKNKTHSLDHRDLPQKKMGSDAAKKKWCQIGIMGGTPHPGDHNAADAAVQEAQVFLWSSTALDGGTQQLQGPRRKSLCHVTRTREGLACA